MSDPIVIAMSATLKAGKEIKGNVKKSLTHPFQSRSMIFATEPPSIKTRLVLAIFSVLKNKSKIIVADISQNIQKNDSGSIIPQLIPLLHI